MTENSGIEKKKIEKIGNESELGRVLNTNFVSDLRRGYVRVKGVVLPDTYPEFADRIRHLDIRDDDIFVCTYPKSGTTWTQEMVWCIANDLNYGGAQTNLAERFPFLDMSVFLAYSRVKEERPEIPMPESFADSVSFVEEMKSPRFIKCHLPFDLLPDNLKNFSTKAKIIYVCRNPKDACVSHFYHSQLFGGCSGSFETFCELFLNDMIPYSPFWDHIFRYRAHRRHSKVLFLTYEDMKMDLPSVIEKTAAFLGKSFTGKEIATLAEHLSFESMKNNRAVNFEPRKEFNQKYGLIERDGSFYRSGVVGGWKKEMTSEMIERFDAWTKEKTGGTDFQFPD